ncbi:hypothetical protein [Capnocytophaga stomatis]|uniref:Uncharacterized protein n=1 Tax=Capnocytophaga stomatis TaxID=1848904 RepID=A0ABW8Q8E4_9FLAO|nr:hypothetical protein [Capnocytophaga stomatis]GIJ93428.1 hypothetical protein CAPN002_06460 [Capnocytophaga stomatis]GIJ96507.1 hypothetical protein CAPN001_10760 [Capnocytophaga stomatis]GIM50193.1 hypothetical protein CAPN003_16450 [Capnocytophaga stomatis]
MKTYLSIIILALFSISCKSDKELSSSDAKYLISAYLEEKPLYETGKFSTDKQRLEAKKDKELIKAIENLVDDGYVEINNEKIRKKWFSKDSVHIIEPTLTKLALPYIISHNKKTSVVKTIIYKLNEKQINIEKNNEKTAVCTVILDKEKTPFYHFGKDPNPKLMFISRKFKLKYDENSGWKIVK